MKIFSGLGWLLFLTLLSGNLGLVSAQSFPQQNINGVNFSAESLFFNRNWFPTAEEQDPYNVPKLSSMIEVNGSLLFGCSEGVNNTSNPLVYCVRKSGQNWEWNYLTLNFDDVSKPTGLGKKYCFVGTDSEGTPYLATARYDTNNGSEYWPYILVLNIDGNEASVSKCYELTFPANGQYVNRQVEVLGSLNDGNFTAVSVVWDGNEHNYWDPSALSARSHLRVWNFESGELVSKKMFNNFLTTFATVQMLSQTQILIDDRGLIDFGNGNIFVSEGELNYIADQPTIYDISGSSVEKLTSINVPAGVYDCGARIFEIDGQSFIFYTSAYQVASRAESGYGPTSYTIASVPKDANGNFDLDNAQQLWTIEQNYPTTEKIENYDRYGDVNEQALSRSYVHPNDSEANLYFSTNGTALTHLLIKSDNSTSNINLELIPESNEEIEIYDLNGRITDLSTPGIYILRTSSGRSYKIIVH